MASAVGCWTSSSKVGRSGFSLSLIIKLCEDVLRLIRLYIHLSSVLVDCTFARVFVFYRSFHTIIHTDAFLRVFVGFLGFFIWCIYVRECDVRSTLRDVFHQLVFVPGPICSSIRPRRIASLFKYRRHLCNFRSSMCSRSRRA